MNNLQESIQKERELQYAVLLKIWEMSKTGSGFIDTMELARQLSITPDAAVEVLDYLSDEGLVELVDDGGMFSKIKHAGKKEIERSLTEPSEGTEHFQPATIYQVTIQGNAQAVQIGGQNNTQNVTVNTVNTGAPIEEITKLIELTKKSNLSDDMKDEAISHLDRVKQLAERPKTEERTKLAKDRLDIFKNSVDVGKTLGEIAVPLLIKIISWFS